MTEQNTRAHTHKEEEEEEEEELEDARRRRMRFYAAEERERRQKREELSMIGALPPITPQKKGKKRIFSRKYAKSIARSLSFFSLSRYTSNEV